MCMSAHVCVCNNGTKKNIKSEDDEAGHLTQPSPADLVGRHRAKFPLRFDLLQDPLVQRRRRLSLWLQLPSWHLTGVDDGWHGVNKRGAWKLTETHGVAASRPAPPHLFLSTLTDCSPDCWNSILLQDLHQQRTDEAIISLNSCCSETWTFMSFTENGFIVNIYLICMILALAIANQPLKSPGWRLSKSHKQQQVRNKCCLVMLLEWLLN